MVSLRYLFISSKLSSKMNTASNWTITAFQHTQGKLGRESWSMMKACTMMTFLMTIVDGYAPETLCRAIGVFSNCLWLIMSIIWQEIGDRSPQWLKGQVTAPGFNFFHVESPSVDCTVVSFLKVYRLGSGFHKPDQSKYQNNQDQNVPTPILVWIQVKKY